MFLIEVVARNAPFKDNEVMLEYHVDTEAFQQRFNVIDLCHDNVQDSKMSSCLNIQMFLRGQRTHLLIIM